MHQIHTPRSINWTLPSLALICWLGCSLAIADDWMTWASTYTHDPVHGARVDQYAVPEQPLSPQRADFVRSGYRNYRSTLQAGQSADNIHVVEQWGNQVIPYEQWRFPYRPYAVPYDAWGPQAPYGIFNGSFGYGGYPRYGGQYPGYGGDGGGVGMNPDPGYGMPGGGAIPGRGGYPYDERRYPYSEPRGFPLTPPYRNQPWYDGTYPSAPPLDPRSDREFFYDPRR
jgi:hypothetical protein